MDRGGHEERLEADLSLRVTPSWVVFREARLQLADDLTGGRRPTSCKPNIAHAFVHPQAEHRGVRKVK